MRTKNRPSAVKVIARPVPKPVPPITKAEQNWQDSVYDADPTGGAPSRY